MKTAVAVLAFASLVYPAVAAGQDAADPHSSPESLVTHLYDLVSFPAHDLPDWDDVRATFIPEAVIILRTSRTGSTTFSVDEFIQDWLTFIDRDNVEERGFTEAIVNMETLEFGDIANVLVLYTSDFPDDDRPPRPGVDSFNLIRQNGRWLIASVLNEIPTAERPIPDVLKKENR